MSSVTSPSVPLPSFPPDAPEAALRWEPGSCAICGSTDAKERLTVGNLIYGRRGFVRIVRCCGCGHLYQSPRPTLATIAAWYPDHYGPHQSSGRSKADAGSAVGGERGLTGGEAAEQTVPVDSSELLPPRSQPWYLSGWARAVPGLRRLYHALTDRTASPVPTPPYPAAQALELGCGAGGYLDQLREAGWEVRGVEPADGPARRCRERGLAVEAAGVESVDLPAGEYELVVAWMVLEHLHDPAAALAQVRQWLRPGGKLMLSVPHVRDWELSVGGRYHYILNEPTHLQHFGRAGLERLLAAEGFRIISFRFQQNLYNQVGWLGLWLQAWCPRLGWGDRLLAFLDDPSMWGRLLLALPAKAMAVCGQTGRVTIIAEQDPRNHVAARSSS